MQTNSSRTVNQLQFHITNSCFLLPTRINLCPCLIRSNETRNNSTFTNFCQPTLIKKTCWIVRRVETALVLMFTITNRINSYPCLIRSKESGNNLTVIYTASCLHATLNNLYPCMFDHAELTRRIKTLNLNTNSCVPISINSYPCLIRFYGIEL